MIRTKAKENVNLKSTNSSLNKQEPDSVMEEEIQEEVHQNLMNSPRRKRKVKVTVVKVKVLHDDLHDHGDSDNDNDAQAFQLKTENDDDDDDKESRQQQPPNVKSSSNPSSSELELELDRWQKRMATKTPEQRIKAERNRFYRQRRKESMTPEELAEKKNRRKERTTVEGVRQSHAESCRRYRNRKKEKMTPEEYENFKRKERERLSKYKKFAPKKLERLGLSPEELKERQRQKERENRRRRMKEMTEEEKEEFRRKRKEWRMNLSKEAKEKQRFYKYYVKQMKLARMTEEEREEWTRRNTEYARKWRESLPPDRLEKYNEYMKRQVKKRIEKMKRERPEEYLKQMRDNTRKWVANQTPEQRQRRLRRYQINAAAKKLRKQLQEDGLLPQEEVEKQVEDLKRKMWKEPLPPLETISSYKPRPRRNPKYPYSDEAATAIPKRRKGRPWGSTIRKRTPSPKPDQPEATTTLLSPGFDAIDDFHFHDHSLDSTFFHEDSNSVTVTPVDISVQDVHEPEVIVQFDLECPHCPSTYQEKSDLLAHILSEHPSQCWKCPLCRSIMLSPAELQEHFKAEHSDTAGATSRKDTGSDAAIAVNVRSLSANSAPLQLQPSEPDTRDNTATGVVMQTPPSSASKTFKCIKCIETDIAFGSHEDLLEHFKSTHPESYWPCPKCNILKYTERSLSIHSKLCKGPSPSLSASENKFIDSSSPRFDCRKCKSVFKSQKNLRIHVKYTHPQSYWLCIHCNEFKFSETSLYRHKNEHCMTINYSRKSVREKKEIQTAQSPLNSSGKRAKSKKRIH